MLSVKMDITAANKMIENVAAKQLPFAFAYTLTLTANDARQEIVRTLPEKFTLRTGWWKPYSYLGFNVRKATKRRLISEIYTRAYFMRWQEEGGIKTPDGQKIAVPTVNVRRTKSNRIPLGKRPSALLRQSKNPAFFMNTKSGSVLFRRVTKQLTAMYVMTRQARIKRRLGMHDTASVILKQNLHKNFEKAFAEAIRSAH